MAAPTALQRLWAYQRERFPLALNGVLIAAVSLSALSYAARLHGRAAPPPAAAVTVFVSCFLFFLQLRIADEFKDSDEDLAHRPYRPVPRGLVTLRELALLGLLAGALQLALVLASAPALLPLLLLVWGYMAVMAREFFVAAWLEARPLAYLATHMLILPLIVLYASGADWRLAGEVLPDARLGWLLLFAFLNGIVVEVGRKLRAGDDEEAGVQTYSALYGPGRALALWLAALALSGAAALLAAAQVGALWAAALLLALALAAAGIAAGRFLARQPAGGGRRFELLSGGWTLAAYLLLGVASLLRGAT